MASTYPSSPYPGAFITLEGIEGAGKSSCLPAVQSYLAAQELNLCVTREPGGTRLAEAIRNLVLGVPGDNGTEAPEAETETLLMFASRAQHLAKVIRPALASGEWVICDRFTDATIAYQGGGRGLGKDRILQLANWLHDDLWPDLTLLFDVSVETGSLRAAKRGARDRIEQERQLFFETARQTYLELARQYPERFRIIDAERPMGEVAAEVEQELENFVCRWRSRHADSVPGNKQAQP